MIANDVQDFAVIVILDTEIVSRLSKQKVNKTSTLVSICYSKKNLSYLLTNYSIDIDAAVINIVY